MNNKNTKKTLTEERERLEGQQPGLAQSYNNFLNSYGQFNRMKAQFEQNREDTVPNPQIQFRTPR